MKNDSFQTHQGSVLRTNNDKQVYLDASDIGKQNIYKWNGKGTDNGSICIHPWDDNGVL